MKRMVGMCLAVCACFFSGSAAAADMKETQSAYHNDRPGFELSVPAACRGWQIRVAQAKDRPILITKTAETDLPFVSSTINFYQDAPETVKKIWADPDKILPLIIEDARRFQKQQLNDVEFLPVRKFIIDGMPAMDSISRSVRSGVTYHSVYVLFPDGIVMLSLNSRTGTFDQDDRDFVSIISTLKKI